MVISINNGNAISLRSSFPSGKILFPQTTEVVFAEMSYFSHTDLATQFFSLYSRFIGLKLRA